MEKKKRFCCICGIELGANEHNDPKPVRNEGECCDYCLYETVIPTRRWRYFHEGDHTTIAKDYLAT